MKEEVTYRTEDHPEVNGRTPQEGDEIYTLRFPLEDGRELVVHTGRKSIDTFSNMVLDMASGAESYNDGSTNHE